MGGELFGDFGDGDVDWGQPRVTEKARRHRTENSVLDDPGGARAGGVRRKARSKHASSYPRRISGEP